METEGSSYGNTKRDLNMSVLEIARTVPPRISETDVKRVTDDGRSFPNNSINTKQHKKGTM